MCRTTFVVLPHFYEIVRTRMKMQDLVFALVQRGRCKSAKAAGNYQGCYILLMLQDCGSR